MEPHTAPSLAQSIAAAQAWWREAGVDLAYHDEPRSWLPPEEAPTDAQAPMGPAAPLEEQRPRIGGDPRNWPRDLASFHRWWLEEPSLEAGGLHGRVAPRGTAHAPLMTLIPMPEAEDREALLSGPQGRLLANMARAMGFAADEVYVAAALPGHLTLPDWGALARDGLGEVLRHHISLVAPKRLLVLGRDVLPLLGHDPAQAAPAVSQLSIQTGDLPMLISYAPERLLEHSRLRAELWRRWLDSTGTGE